MIKIKYECDETGQSMDVSIELPEIETDSCKVNINFDPPIGKNDDEIEDPYMIASKIADIVLGRD